jgi:hypothetical protein
VTRTELIEALAEAQWRWHHPVMQWQEAPDPIKRAYRVQVEDGAAVVVELVAAWLETVPMRYEPEPRPWELARKWREDMA